jgi:cysteine synthase
MEREGKVPNMWLKDRKFDHRVEESTESGSSSSKNELKEAMAGATNIAEAAKAAENALKTNVAHAMTAAPEDIDVEKPLHTFGGMQSLIQTPVSWMYSY